MFWMLIILSLFPIIESIKVGKIKDNNMIGMISKSLVNLTFDQCICEMMKSNELISAVNYFQMNQTCQLFSSNMTSILITFNPDSTFVFINLTSILITSIQSDMYSSQSAISSSSLPTTTTIASTTHTTSTMSTTRTTTTTTAVARCNTTFSAQATYSMGSGSGPASVFVADVNNDNKPDLIVGNHDGSNIAVLFNFGNGTFRSQSYFSTGSNTGLNSLSVADVNGDSKPDIIVANQIANNVGVFFNTGNGTFLASETYSTGYSSSPSCLSLGDVNNDSKPDIIVANYNTNNVGVFLNSGNGTFRSQTIYSIGSSLNPQAVFIADVNSDSKPDIIIGNHGDNTVGVLFNAGDGTFLAWIPYSTGSGSKPYSVFVADLNHDSKPDIIVANSGAGNVGVLLNSGNGTFRSQSTYATGSGSSPHSIFIVDVNNDSEPDIIVANNGANNIGVLFNAGNGTFLSQKTYPTSLQPFSIAVVDVDSNSKPDIVVANYGGDNVGVFLAC